ncbi:MAG: TetR/AcrR family transcriptional regulator [Deltaproteobacteria bacterium]|nr:TetR/AcrR family transcriptional regulator [Deltaproteobacteria bacterium]
MEDYKDHFLCQNIPTAPPGKIKLAIGLETLLKHKNFNSITTAEIARVSGVNESLIYRYFTNKRGLLHFILAEYLKETVRIIYADLQPLDSPVAKLRQLIWRTIENWRCNPVYAKILLLEVRNFQGYFKSETYGIVMGYAKFIRALIREGIARGEIRREVSPWFAMQVILGSIEHVVLPSIIFNQKLDADQFTEKLCEVVFHGLATRRDA